MSLVYAVRDSSLHVLGHASSKRCHGEFICAGGLCCKQLFHALASAPPYLATEVESNSLRSREVTLGTSRYQIPRSGLVQSGLCRIRHKPESLPPSENSLAIYRDLALADVSDEYEQAM